MEFNPHKKGYIADINVTPFVDVMLVLLIIFMVTAPLLTQGVEVDLPQTQTVETLPEDSQEIILTVKKDGSVLIDEYEVPLGELDAHLEKLAKQKEKLLYLRADKAVPYGVVVQVMAAVKRAGISKLGVVAEPEKQDRS
ncbi:protein TolR [Desulfohalobium retbaense]|uniref:Protein TolR n=1 Tax=Desulfohalobium retbaense (strain ATCC 49708 / DSM 5692 / JCM 16813 / HR100) TaxID=485915 RepID=C8X374_DESRD|nr:protein TolR [Desulfohalobium retbaense]ACV68871.1 protein TolR [Desulfohalobium retbaense DSM 5692]